MDNKSCIRCGKSARFAPSFGEFVCTNQKCKYREHYDTPHFSMEVLVANSWWSSLKNDDKITISKNCLKAEHYSNLSTQENSSSSSTNIEKPNT